MGVTIERDGMGCACGGPCAVNLHQIIREIRDQPRLTNSPIKGNKTLKPEKWQAIFDNDGRVYGFKKALKLIVLGGVDPSIRTEVWEFLLGCYALDSTAEHRRQLRMARREKYKDLIKQCQTMHSTVGTGSLAHVVGSKVMDVRTASKDNGLHVADVGTGQDMQVSGSGLEVDRNLNNHCMDSLDARQRESSTDSADLASARGSIERGSNYSSCALPPSDAYDGYTSKSQQEEDEFQHSIDRYFDFPPLPVTNLFQTNSDDDDGCEMHDERSSTKRRYTLVEDSMHSFQIDKNVDLIIELPTSLSKSKTEIFSSTDNGHMNEPTKLEYKKQIVNRLRKSNVPEADMINGIAADEVPANEERISEWLWTLHRIVVDVVRTDSHLKFFEDARTMARMSDVLAVYAWVDPATGYCQGMSDLLSPFIVLYEDNADAFWCFEMLLRRMRDNFQMEGPTGVMKQLQSLWEILELVDSEMFRHLALIGAESLHFAFPMLLVLFRRELSFNDALRMWEMMWAADFDDAVTQELDESCLEPLIIHLPRDPSSGGIEESMESGQGNSKELQSGNGININHYPTSNCEVRSSPSHPFCGLTRASFWARHSDDLFCSIVSSARSRDDEMPIFCAAAILIINRQKILKETQSIDDLFKMFNDKMLRINVKKCVRTAIKLRKKYFYKIMKQSTLAT